jgi:hypothetical protein
MVINLGGLEIISSAIRCDTQFFFGFAKGTFFAVSVTVKARIARFLAAGGARPRLVNNTRLFACVALPGSTRHYRFPSITAFDSVLAIKTTKSQSKPLKMGHCQQNH